MRRLRSPPGAGARHQDPQPMFFQSAGFLFLFLPVAVALLWTLPPGRIRLGALVAMSYLFYSGGEPFFVVLLLTSSLVDWVAAQRLHDTTGPRRPWLLLSIATNLGLLAVFKYGQLVGTLLFEMGAVGEAGDAVPGFIRTLVLPAGISFYTFQTLAYTIDVYRRQVEPSRDLLAFMGYVAYLPQLIAGPIERYHRLYGRLMAFVDGHSTPQFAAGFTRLAAGVAQKLLIADACGRIVDALSTSTVPAGLLTSWAIATGFGLQIYYDFAAYTSMAIGVSALLGVPLTENFNSPYRARNVREFWQRWHITLSTWFRDYVYIPLGGSRSAGGRVLANLFLTFVLSGLWHGAGWNFIAWGAGHGLALMALRLWSRAGVPAMPTPLAVLLTYVVVSFLWVPFRIEDVGQIIEIWGGMVGLHGLAAGVLSPWDWAFLLLVLAGTWALPNCSQRWPGKSGLPESAAWWAIALFAVVSSPQVHQFIYFQF